MGKGHFLSRESETGASCQSLGGTDMGKNQRETRVADGLNSFELILQLHWKIARTTYFMLSCVRVRTGDTTAAATYVTRDTMLSVSREPEEAILPPLRLL